MFKKNRRLQAFILAVAFVAIGVVAGWPSWPADPASAGRPDRESRSPRPNYFGAWDDEYEIADDESDAARKVARLTVKRYNINQLYVIASPENGIAPLPELKRK